MLSIVFLIAQATSAPSPAATLSPEWNNVPPDDATETRSYVRKEADGTEATITLERQVCDCDPADKSSEVQTMFELIPGRLLRGASYKHAEVRLTVYWLLAVIRHQTPEPTTWK